MSRRLLLVFICSALLGQVAENANRHYKSAEGRAQLARGMASAERHKRDRPRELVREMGVKPGMTVADIGTGSGFMLPFLSEAVGPGGRVLAEDIFSDFLEKAKQRAREKGLSNVVFIQGAETTPKLPEGAVDLALVLDVYHHFDYPQQMLAGIRSALQKQGRLVVVDYYRRPGAMRWGDAMSHIRADESEVIREIEAAGFRLAERRERIPGSQYLLIFEKR